MIFAKLEALASGAVDRQFGERVHVVPRSAGPFVGGGPDPDRVAFEATAIVDLTPVLTSTERSGAAATSLSVDAIHVSFATSALVFTPHKGDRIVALERAERAFAISTIEPDGVGRVLCRCTEVTGP